MAKVGSSTCHEKGALLAAFTQATTEYAKVVAELNEQGGTISRAQWLQLHTTADQYRLSVEAARTALNAHIASHGC